MRLPERWAYRRSGSARSCGARVPSRPDTALRLARYFGTSAEFWIGMQATYDLEVAAMPSARGSTPRLVHAPPDPPLYSPTDDYMWAS